MSAIKRTDKNDIQEALRGLHERCEPDGILTGISSLDDFLGGFRKGDLIVVGGRPSMGRTAFSLSMVKNIAIRDKEPLLYISWNVSKDVLLRRLLCLVAGIDYPPYTLKEEERRKLEEAGREITEGKLYLLESRELTMEDLEQSISELEETPRLLIVDDLQMLAER